MNVNTIFCRLLLKETHKEVKASFPTMKLNSKECWVIKLSGGYWEFHCPGYYWYGMAENAYDARQKGWSGYLKKVKRD